MSSILKGILTESENVSVVYVDGKPSVKYTNINDAKKAVELMKKKNPNKNFEIKQEIRETEAIKGIDGKRCWKGKRYAGTADGKDKCIPVDEAGSAAQQAAIAINMKKQGKKPKHVDEAKAKQYVKPYNDPQTGKQIGWKSSDGYHVKYWRLADSAKAKAYQHAKISPDEVQEDYTGQFAAEKTAKINPYGGSKDNQFRGAISETPTDNPTGTSGEGGRRTYRPKPAGEIEEDTAYAGGMGQGHTGQSYRKFKPKMAGTNMKKESSIMKGLTK